MKTRRSRPAGSFCDVEVGGVRSVDWLTSFINGEPIEDVECTECGDPAA